MALPAFAAERRAAAAQLPATGRRQCCSFAMPRSEVQHPAAGNPPAANVIKNTANPSHLSLPFSSGLTPRIPRTVYRYF